MRPLLSFSCFVLASLMLCISPARAQHFTGCVSLTGHNATVLIPTAAVTTPEAQLLAVGDEIAAFTHDGICAGVATWNGKNLALTLWGDDPMSPEMNGFAQGEPLTLKVRRAAGVDEAVRVTYSAARPYYRTDGAYAENGIYVIETLAIENSGLADQFSGAAAMPVLKADTPQAFSLAQNYPNPFNPSTTIAYRLDAGAQVQLEVVNVQGQPVRTLVAQYQDEGDYELTFNAADLPSGMYFCRLTAGQATQTRSMLLVK